MKLTEEELKMGVYDPTKGHPKNVAQLYAAAKKRFSECKYRRRF
jgi:hypothetical protein